MSKANTGYGPFTSISAASTGPGLWGFPRGQVLSAWAYHIATSNSTSAVTVKHKLQGTLSESSAPAAADIFTISAGSGAGYVAATGKPAVQVRANITSITSTSSTAPKATAVVGGGL